MVKCSHRHGRIIIFVLFSLHFRNFFPELPWFDYNTRKCCHLLTERKPMIHLFHIFIFFWNNFFEKKLYRNFDYFLYIVVIFKNFFFLIYFYTKNIACYIGNLFPFWSLYKFNTIIIIWFIGFCINIDHCSYMDVYAIVKSL